MISAIPLNGEKICTSFIPQFVASNTNPEVGEAITLMYTGTTCFNNAVCNANQFAYSIPGSATITGLAIQTNTGQVQDVSVSWNNPGVYTVTLMVTASTGCTINSVNLQPVTITVGSNAIPTMGQWGIITLFLSMMIITVVSRKEKMGSISLLLLD